MRMVKQFLACGLAGVIFGVVFLKIESSFIGFLIGSSMGALLIWILYVVAYLLHFFVKIFFKEWIFVFSCNISFPYGFLFINEKNKARIFFISVIENYGVEITKNIERDK